MTNREWLNSLSDEEFAIWCCDDEQFDICKDNTLILAQPSPRLNRIKMQWSDSKYGLTQWLKEKRR